MFEAVGCLRPVFWPTRSHAGEHPETSSKTHGLSPNIDGFLAQ
jgi:hypothetical protein